MKRPALKRTASLTRTPMSRQRTSLPARSQKRTDELPERRAVWAVVHTRDRVCQVRVIAAATGYAAPPCRGRLTPHHRRKASAGGAYTTTNLVVACAGCNEAMEADADLARWAHSVGLVVRRGDEEWERLGRGRA